MYHSWINTNILSKICHYRDIILKSNYSNIKTSVQKALFQFVSIFNQYVINSETCGIYITDAILRGVQYGRFITFRISILRFNHNVTKHYGN